MFSHNRGKHKLVHFRQRLITHAKTITQGLQHKSIVQPIPIIIIIMHIQLLLILLIFMNQLQLQLASVICLPCLLYAP